MPPSKPLLDKVVVSSALQDIAAVRIASAVAGWSASASPLPTTGIVASGVLAASPIPTVRTAASPVLTASPIPTVRTAASPGVGAVTVSSAAAAAFASGIAARLGFASDVPTGDVFSSLSGRIASALAKLPELAGLAEVNSQLSTMVASMLIGRLAFQPDVASPLGKQMRSITVASGVQARLERRGDIDG